MDLGELVRKTWCQATPVAAIVSLASLVGVVLSGNSVFALQAAEIYEKFGPAVVTVVGPENFGSGFAIPPGGQVVTNYHVVGRQTWLEVILPTGEKRRVVSVVAEDPDRDLAVLNVSPPLTTSVVLGDSSAARVGERVVVIGSPRGLRQTVTDGIVSQVRTLREGGITLLQTTAPVSPGSSGGPLFNEQGEVIGVVSFSRSQSQNLNFAVGINELRRLLALPPATRLSLPRPTQPQAGRREPPAAPSGRFTIHLWNGTRASTGAYEETSYSIVYDQPGGRVTVPRTLVARITDHESGTVREFSPPPASEPRAAPAERKIDIQELISRPRPVAPPPGSGAPLAPSPMPAQGECAQDAEDVSTAERQVIAPHVVRLKQAGRWRIVEVRGLHPAALPHPRDGQYLEEVLSVARTISLTNRRLKANDRDEAAVCVDGKNLAEHPHLRRFWGTHPAAR